MGCVIVRVDYSLYDIYIATCIGVGEISPESLFQSPDAAFHYATLGATLS